MLMRYILKNIGIIIPNISNPGGTERSVINLSNMLISDFNVEIISLYNHETEISTFYSVDEKVKLTSLKILPKNALRNAFLSYTVLRSNPNILAKDIIIGTWYGVNLLLPLVFPSKCIKIVCEHTDFELNKSFVKFFSKFLYPKVDAVVALSEVAANKFQHSRDNIVVIPNSLPFIPKRASNLNETSIIMVGRLVPVKGYERVIGLAKELKANYPNWKIKIFGEGELKEEIINLIQGNNLNNITLYNFSKNIDLEYIKSSIYLSTSYSEAMPMVFLEAMSCGLPVVSFRNEGAEVLIQDGTEGYIVDNEDQLIKITSQLIENYELRKFMGDNGLRKAQMYNPEIIKTKWLDLIEKLNESSRGKL